MKLGGVIYLLSIADKRMKGTTRKNLDMFRQVCGDKAFERVVLGTTNWGEVNETLGKMREQQLTETVGSIMIDSGSKSLRFDKTKKSARAFLDAILGQLKLGEYENFSDFPLRAQDVPVAFNQSIPETIPEVTKGQYDPQMTKSLPVLILYSFLSVFIVAQTDSLY